MTQGYSGKKDVVDATNVGNGSGEIYKQKNSLSELELRTLDPGSTDVTVVNNGDNVSIDVVSDTAATANTIAKRDAGGRLKAADPVATDDVVTKNHFDTNLPEEIFHSAGGTTASGTAGTLVASIEAQAGNKLVSVNMSAFCHNNGTGSSELKVTFTDDTTNSRTIVQGNWAHGNEFGHSYITDASGPNGATVYSKDIKKIEMLTVGTGTCTRSFYVNAREVPI